VWIGSQNLNLSGEAKAKMEYGTGLIFGQGRKPHFFVNARYLARPILQL
jgi:hypothetical protein